MTLTKWVTNMTDKTYSQSADELKKTIQEVVKVSISNLFSTRKITDTPTDDLMVTPRKYVNMFGSTLGRPVNSVVGQQYFDTTIGRPIYRNGSGAWVDGAGSIS